MIKLYGRLLEGYIDDLGKKKITGGKLCEITREVWNEAVKAGNKFINLYLWNFEDNENNDDLVIKQQMTQEGYDLGISIVDCDSIEASQGLDNILKHKRLDDIVVSYRTTGQGRKHYIFKRTDYTRKQDEIFVKKLDLNKVFLCKSIELLNSTAIVVSCGKERIGYDDLITAIENVETPLLFSCSNIFSNFKVSLDDYVGLGNGSDDWLYKELGTTLKNNIYNWNRLHKNYKVEQDVVIKECIEDMVYFKDEPLEHKWLYKCVKQISKDGKFEPVDVEEHKVKNKDDNEQKEADKIYKIEEDRKEAGAWSILRYYFGDWFNYKNNVWCKIDMKGDEHDTLDLLVMLSLKCSKKKARLHWTLLKIIGNEVINRDILLHFRNGYIDINGNWYNDNVFTDTQLSIDYTPDILNDLSCVKDVDEGFVKLVCRNKDGTFNDNRVKSLYSIFGGLVSRKNDGYFGIIYNEKGLSGKTSLLDMITLTAFDETTHEGLIKYSKGNKLKKVNENFSLTGTKGKTGIVFNELGERLGNEAKDFIKTVCDSRFTESDEKYDKQRLMDNILNFVSTTNNIIKFSNDQVSKSVKDRIVWIDTHSIENEISIDYTDKVLMLHKNRSYFLHRAIKEYLEARSDMKNGRALRFRFNCDDTLKYFDEIDEVYNDLKDKLLSLCMDNRNNESKYNEALDDHKVILDNESKESIFKVYEKDKYYTQDKILKDIKQAFNEQDYNFESKKLWNKQAGKIVNCYIFTKERKGE